jgi:hypothetical protein
MSTTSQDPEVLGGELVFAGTRVPVSPGQHGAGGMEHGVAETSKRVKGSGATVET